MLKYYFVFILFSFGYIYSQTIDSVAAIEMKAHSRLFKTAKVNYPGDSTIDVKYYRLNLTIDHATKSIAGDVVVRSQVKTGAGINSFFLDLKSNMILDSVKSGTNLLNSSHNDDLLNVHLEKTYKQNEYFNVTVYYHGFPDEGNFGGFVFDQTNKGNPAVWSLSEPYESKNWWPCKDALTDKADSADIWITASPYFTSVSNGVLTEVLNNANGTKTFKWKVRHPIAHYLISIAMADYVLQTDYFHYSAVDSMPVIHYIWRESYNTRVKSQLSRTIPALQIFSELYGPYPWLDEKYGHAQCSFSGGMEHQTIASMGGFEESLVVHELAHQWFGDKITCETWQDIWLNEGFATYSEALYYEKIYGKSDYNSYIGTDMQLAFLALGSVYVKDISRLSEIFDPFRSYAKGSVVLHMLRGVVGDSSFFKILKTYAQHPEFSYSTATTADFQKVAEDISGVDLDYFFNQWIYGQNYPKYKINWGYKYVQDSTYSIDIKIDQNTNINPQYFTMPVQIKVKTDKGDTLVTLFNDQKNQTFNFNIIGQPEFVEFDPNNLILKTYTILTDSGSEPLIRSFVLSQNYPNPFNPSTKIDFYIPGDGRNREFNVMLRVYDILGNEMALLVNSKFSPGDHTVEFEPARYGFSSGIYFYNLNVKDPQNDLLYNRTGKMIYLR